MNFARCNVTRTHCKLDSIYFYSSPTFTPTSQITQKVTRTDTRGHAQRTDGRPPPEGVKSALPLTPVSPAAVPIR
jgi:hypothetical protein